MMITSVALSAIVQDKPLSVSHASLLLASHTIDGTPKLIGCSWLAVDERWQDSIKLQALQKRYDVHVSNNDSDKGTPFLPAIQLDTSDPEQQLLLASMAQIQQYLQGSRYAFELPLDFSLGTDFQQRVWKELQKIPHGETISYATLAQRVNNPKGYRAVANANGKNPFSLIVPCHRVISSDGKLGGYTGGLDNKEYLLALEGVKCKT